MTERDRDDEERLSTDEGIRPEIGTRIGAVPGEDDPVNISGFPGGATGWGAWPEGMGTHDAPDQPDAENGNEEDAEAEGQRVGARHGQIADSGVNTGPVST